MKDSDATVFIFKTFNVLNVCKANAEKNGSFEQETSMKSLIAFKNDRPRYQVSNLSAIY